MAAATIGNNEYSAIERWRVEFDDALHLALIVGVTKPLREYVAAGKPIPDKMVHVRHWKLSGTMAKLVDELLGRSVDEPPRRRGRPRRIASEAPPAQQAERNVATLLALQIEQWRKETGRKRAPRTEVEKALRLLVIKAEKAFKVPRKDAISERNILEHIKKLRFKAP